jgi:hypothetical protein
MCKTPIHKKVGDLKTVRYMVESETFDHIYSITIATPNCRKQIGEQVLDRLFWLMSLYVELALFLLKGETAVIILSARDDGVVLLACDEIEAEDSKRNSRQDDTEGTVINAEGQTSTISVESVVNLLGNILVGKQLRTESNSR